MKEPLYHIFKYGPLGVVDVRYVKLRKGQRIEWTTDRSKASVFKHSRAKALVSGYHSVRVGSTFEDLVIIAVLPP